MQNHILLAVLMCSSLVAHAQTRQDTTTVKSDFSYTSSGNKVSFTPVLPPLPPAPAGAPQPFYTYHWEFGDGGYSSLEKPEHHYAVAGNYTPMLYATNSYDDGKTPLGGGKGIMANGGPVDADDFNTLFKDDKKGIAMKAIRGARKNEEMVLILSYQNPAKLDTDGELYLFFNENAYPDRHFAFLNGRTHYGEQLVAPAVSSASDVSPDLMEMTQQPKWASVFSPTNGVEIIGDDAGDFPIPNMLVDNARKVFRDEKVWSFPMLKTGERRNMFLALKGTEKMLKDTSAIIHVKGIFVPGNPGVASEEFTLDIEIVASHDPNGIMVSDVRVNYRLLAVKDLNYKVKFQNNGEGPAKKVEVSITIPEGLNMSKVKPVDWYPKCPVCPKEPTTKSCLDFTTTDNGIVFTFRNIYLPGSHQKGITEYDSTKGFVKYRIVPEKNMPKRPFRSQAKIVFDKNPPIFTNYSRTRFKPGFSPGPKVGYGFFPGNEQVYNPDTREFEQSGLGYAFLGCTFSPYKSWRLYPQVEVITGFRGRTEIGETSIQSLDTTALLLDVGPQGTPTFFLRDSTTDVVQTGSRGFVSVEIPVSIRKNINRWIGVGLGASGWILFDNGQTLSEGTYIIGQSNATQIDPTGQPIWVKDVSEPQKINQISTYSNTRFRGSVFGDINLGAVRAGPYVGIRGGYLLGGEKLQPFVQVSAGVKL